MRIAQPTVTAQELELLREVCAGRRVLELGAGFGYSTVEIAAVCEAVVSVDWHGGDDQAGFGDTLGGYLDRVHASPHRERIIPMVGRFRDVLPFLGPGRFEVLFHDGHHSADSVYEDLGLALPLCYWGAAVAIHDWTWSEAPLACRVMLGEPDRLAGSLAVYHPRPGPRRSADGGPGADVHGRKP